MSVLGIDIGTSYCVLATIQRGAVAVVRNDLSERLTPALVGFTNKERLIGEEAQTQLRSNYRNTCRYIKQLLGCSYATSEDIAMEREFALAELSVGSGPEEGMVGYCVQYKGQDRFFTATRVMAALLTKLKTIAEKATQAPVYDVVISVPGWFTDKARQAMLDAASVAGLRCLRTMNEHAAVALDYGIYRSNTFDAERPSRVTFVGMGHGSTTVSVVEFVKGELRVLAVTCDKTLGGRNVDLCLVKHFATLFEQRYGINPLKNKKAFLKLEETATKAKKMLSANSEAPYNVECLVEDYDLTGLLTRQDFEQLCAPVQERLSHVLQSTLANAGITPEDIHHIELVGGCTRIPCFQKTISASFNDRLPLSKTLSMDETVARGCALQAAMLNPRYRVREFNVVDRVLEDICVSWPRTSEDGSGTDPFKTSVLFETGSVLGSTKWLTFQRDTNLELRLLSGAHSEPLIAEIELPAEEARVPTALPKRVKVKARLSHHGTALWDTAQLLVDEEVEEIVKEKRQPESAAAEAQGSSTTTATTPAAENSSVPAEGAPVPAPETPAAAEYVDVVKKKIKTKRFDCKLRQLSRRGYLTSEAKTTLAESEAEMAKDDDQQQRRKEAMNELESYIYNLRSKLGSQLREFCTPEENKAVQDLLAQAQDFVYANPDSTRESYEQKLNELQAAGKPIERRYNELVQRKEEGNRLFQTLANFRAASSSPDYAHVDRAKMQSFVAKVADVENWLTQVLSSHDAAPLYRDPTVTAADLVKERETLENYSRTVLIPKPVEIAPPPASSAADQQATSSPRGKKHQDDDSQDASFCQDAGAASVDHTMQDVAFASETTPEADVRMS